MAANESAVAANDDACAYDTPGVARAADKTDDAIVAVLAAAAGEISWLF